MSLPGHRRRRAELLREAPTLERGQQVAQVLRALGENTYALRLGGGGELLARLPKRLRDVAYIRRDSFVFVRAHDAPRGRVVADIELVVLPAFLPALRAQRFWPAAFRAPPRAPPLQPEQPDSDASDGAAEPDWQRGQGNPNRRYLSHAASSDEESGSDDDDESDGDDHQRAIPQSKLDNTATTARHP